MTRFAQAVVVAVSLLAYGSIAYAAGGSGVGITAPECGIDDPELGCTFSYSDCEGSHPNFHQANLEALGIRINTDLDILYSQSFLDYRIALNNPSWEVTPPELIALAERIDNTTTNPLGADYERWDLPLIFDFYTPGNILYGGFPSPSFFEFRNRFLDLGWTVEDRNHVDVYLVPLFERQVGCNPQFFNTTCCRVAAGTTPAQFKDDDEDAPSGETCPGTDERWENSVQIWDHWGNRDDVRCY